MGENIYVVIVALCALVILSYGFTVLSKKTRIPTVLLLLVAGIGIREILLQTGHYQEVPEPIIEFIGVIGLILILLDAGLDLKFYKNKKQLIKKAAESSLVAMLLSVAGIGVLIHYWLDATWLASIVFALPLSIISSAIVASTVGFLSEEKREFLTYEAAFSDMAGILLFGYLTTGQGVGFGSFVFMTASIVFAFGLSIIFSLLLVWLVVRSSVHIKSFLVFAILLLLYSFGELWHLPSLLIVILFGLIINNWGRVNKYLGDSWAQPSVVREITGSLKLVTAESAFLIRTFFFTLFGYTIDVRTLADANVLLIGSVVVAVIYIARYIYLRLFAHTHIIPELFFAPRGLVTILLLYQIPQELEIAGLEAGIMFFVVIATILIMMFGSMFFTPPGATREADKN